jgi:hypothetical protein
MSIVLRCAAVALAITTLAARAWAYVYYTEPALLASFFPGAQVADVVYTPSPAELTALQAQLGYALPKPSYTLHVGKSGTDVLGYAVVDDQLGLHEPITFGVLVGPDGAVQRIEVMVYREAYGDGVRAPTFRNQFTGLNATSPMRAGKEIHIVSGATVSSRSLSTGVRRAAALVAAWRAGHPAGA